MNYKIVDSHCHLNLLGRKEQGYELRKKEIIIAKIKDSLRNHVQIVQNICVNLEEFEEFYPLIFDEHNGVLALLKKESIEIDTKNEFDQDFKKNLENFEIYTSLGLHPLYPNNNFEIEKAKKFVSYKFVNAIGECGLDYHLEPDIELRRKQQADFLMQIDLAARSGLPLIIHTRNAEAQTYHYLHHAYMQRNISGVMHCFTGSKELALKMIDIGFFISFPGIITFKKKADYLHEIIRDIPIERILIETDAPYLAPEPFRGKENHPAFLFYVCQKIAEIKKLDIEEVAFQTTKNYKNLFLKKFTKSF